MKVCHCARSIATARRHSGSLLMMIVTRRTLTFLVSTILIMRNLRSAMFSMAADTSITNNGFALDRIILLFIGCMTRWKCMCLQMHRATRSRAN
ncbi:hypothetical protein BX666DRAFT_1940917, partial [Dichotomocladium elegans]